MLKKFLWTLFLVFIFIFAYKVVPIYYKAFALEGLCKENADLFHRYNKTYISKKMDEELERLGIPKKQRETALTKTKDEIVVEIYYEDTADFFGYYRKNYVFIEECEGVLRSVISN